MKPPRLDLQAVSAEDLLSQLANIDIAVPLQTEGRRTGHREQYMMARLLATLANAGRLEFPLRVEHRDKPDFALHFPDESIAVECVEAVSEEWAQIQAIRERDFPDAMIYLPMLTAGGKKFTLAERVSIAKGETPGHPWVGKMASQQWADAHAYFIAGKTSKLRAGNYSEFRHAWLLVQDEWVVPLHRQAEIGEAAELCAAKIEPSLRPPTFDRIYICTRSWLVRLVPAPVHVSRISNLWNDG